MSEVHAIVWLDHREAHIAAFSLGSERVFEVHSRKGKKRIHTKRETVGSGKLADDHIFFDEIVHALAGMREVLIAGPGNAKVAFEKYARQKHREFAKHIVGVETLDHPTDAQLLAHARAKFTAIDQMGVANS